jgi:hypothetical protein
MLTLLHCALRWHSRHECWRSLMRTMVVSNRRILCCYLLHLHQAREVKVKSSYPEVMLMYQSGAPCFSGLLFQYSNRNQTHCVKQQRQPIWYLCFYSFIPRNTQRPLQTFISIWSDLNRFSILETVWPRMYTHISSFVMFWSMLFVRHCTQAKF